MEGDERIAVRTLILWNETLASDKLQPQNDDGSLARDGRIVDFLRDDFAKGLSYDGTHCSFVRRDNAGGSEQLQRWGWHQ